jgi:hypothetical protein
MGASVAAGAAAPAPQALRISIPNRTSTARTLKRVFIFSSRRIVFGVTVVTPSEGERFRVSKILSN